MHIRSTIEAVDHDEATSWCITEGFAGVGWGLWDGRNNRKWHEYVDDYAGEKGKLNGNVRRFHDLAIGTLIWSRERNGRYWLGRIEGDWEYRDDETAQRLDLFNLRSTSWHPVGTEDRVPGRVVNAFRSRMTLQRIVDSGARAYSRRAYFHFLEPQAPVESPGVELVIKSYLGPEDLEDLVAVYLQDTLDYLVVSRLRSTPGYEYVLRNRVTGKTAVASVKSGDTPVDLDLLPVDAVDAAFAYAVSERYVGSRDPKITCIQTDTLARFIRARRKILPDRISDWLAR